MLYIGLMTRSYWQIKGEHLRVQNRNMPDISGAWDIAVVGGGLMGIAIAHYLKALGCDRVIVLEKEYVSYGASGRNAGFLLSGMAEPFSRLEVGLGPDWAKALMLATIENHDLVADPIAVKSIKCDYQRTGSYHLAVSETEERELAESVDLLNKNGFPGEFVDSNEIRNRLGLKHCLGGYFNPIDGNLDPYAFVNGLSRGLDIIEGFEVKEIQRSNGQIKLIDDSRTIRSEMAVLATNAYTPILDNSFKEMIFPVRGQMLATGKGLNDKLGKSTYYANFGYDYFRQSPDGTILMGGLRDKFLETEVGYADEINPNLQDGLENYVRFNFELAQFDVPYRWSGLMANTIDGLPLVGALPHNGAVVAAVGCNGHGFGLGMIIARDLALALMVGKTSDLLNRFSLKRFLR
jgi:gamma-glutamylputrescine oxidase